MLEAKYSRKDENGPETGRADIPADSELWSSPWAEHPFSAEVELPGSKSLMARELILSAIASSPSSIINPLDSRDTTLMLEALEALGTEFKHSPGRLEVIPAKELTGSTSIACGLAGTVMRFVPALAALALGPSSFDGDPYARERPMATLVDSLRSLGADISDDGSGRLPFTVHGTGSLPGGVVELDASASSQFVSALLLAGSKFENGVHIKHTGDKLPSIPHIDMTIATLEARGVRVKSVADREWILEPSVIEGREVTIEPDLSNAAPFLAAAVATGSSVSVPNWPSETTQVGDQLRTLLQEFGAKTSLDSDVLTVTGPEKVSPVNLHVPEAGELAPTLVGLAALASGKSTITGIGHIRNHETDRIAALATELRLIGCEVEELEDGLHIVPATNPVKGVWRSYDDHRMATTGALIGLKVQGLEVENIATTAKTMPRFPKMWTDMLGA